MTQAPIIGVERHRIGRDGKGVTTLAAFHGCPLRCRYCLNPQCHDNSRPLRMFTPKQLLEAVSIDNLYFLATGGGITFGGGEPMVRSEFISELCGLMPREWNITVETSLNVAQHHLQTLLPFVNDYIVDIKDMHPEVYKDYAKCGNDLVVSNLRWLAANGKASDVVIRLPLIPHFNDEQMRIESQRWLEEMGFSQFDKFDYVTGSFAD